MQIIVLLILSALSFGKLSHLTCSSSGTHLIFINGVNVNSLDTDQFQININALLTTLNPTLVDQKSIISSEFVHNSSEGMARDIAETFYLYLETRGDERNNPATLELLVSALF